MPHPASSSPAPYRRWSLDALPPSERQRIAAVAASLAQAAREGQQVQPLRGKNVAVLCEVPDCPGISTFRQAADALGARVTHIRPSDALTPPAAQLDAVSALLGRLYDAIDCHGVPADEIARLARSTGKPVFNALGCQPGAEHDGVDVYTLQAMLLTAMA